MDNLWIIQNYTLKSVSRLQRNYSYYKNCRVTTVTAVTAEKLQKAIINSTAIINSVAATCGPFRVVSYCPSKRNMKQKQLQVHSFYPFPKSFKQISKPAYNYC